MKTYTVIVEFGDKYFSKIYTNKRKATEAYEKIVDFVKKLNEESRNEIAWSYGNTPGIKIPFTVGYVKLIEGEE